MGNIRIYKLVNSFVYLVNDFGTVMKVNFQNRGFVLEK